MYTLRGVGASVVYAEYAGKQQQKMSEKAFSIVFTASVVIGVLSTYALYLTAYKKPLRFGETMLKDLYEKYYYDNTGKVY